MSAAVVSTSVMGSAATMIHLGAGSDAGERADLFAERAGVGEEQRGVEPEDHASRQPLGMRVAAHVVIPGHARYPAEDRLVGPPRPAEDVADRQGDGHGDPGEHAERHDAEQRRDRQRELGPSDPVEPHRPRHVGQRDRRGDDDRGKRRLGQVAQQPGGQQQDQRDRRRADQPGDLRLRTGLLRHSGARAARADREALEQSGREVRRPDARSSPGSRRPSGRSGPRTRTRSRWCRRATPARCPARPPASSARSDSPTLGIVSGGNPWGRTPTRSTPRSSRCNSAGGADGQDDDDEDRGHLRQHPLQHQDHEQPEPADGQRGRDRRAVGDTPDEAGDLTEEARGVHREPEELGELADQDRQGQPVHVADHRRLRDQVRDEAEPADAGQHGDRAGHQRERRGERDRAGRIPVRADQREDRRGDHGSERGVRAEDEDP